MKIIAIFIGVFFAIYHEKLTRPKTDDSDIPVNGWDLLDSIIADAVTATREIVSPVSSDPIKTPERTTPVFSDIENTPVSFGTKYDKLIVNSAVQNRIEPMLLYRLLNQESRFKEDIITGKTVSPAGALGIAQFMPATAVEWLGSTVAALDPTLAIPGAAKYLRWLINKFDGNIEKAVAAYNWGIGNVQRKGLEKAPAETVAYVQAVYYGA